MGRHFIVVGLIGTLSILSVGSARAQSPHPRPRFFNRPIQQFRNQQPQLQPRFQIAPEDQQVFRKNAERWLQMTQQERMQMRQREQIRRDRIRVEADTVLRDSGMRLTDKERDLFQQRFLQERRRIDRELRQEYEAKRQQQLERLKKEFQPSPMSPTGVPNASQVPSASPVR